MIRPHRESTGTQKSQCNKRQLDMLTTNTGATIMDMMRATDMTVLTERATMMEVCTSMIWLYQACSYMSLVMRPTI
jgi:hypothetical protein